MIYIIEYLAVSAITPILLIPIEELLPYPYLIEEIVIFLLVRKLAKKKYNCWHATIAGGALFTLTESFLYLPNIISSSGDINVLLERLAYTGILHIGTGLGMFFGNRKSNTWGIISLIAAMIVHYLFNWFWINKG
jgi:hypothetical protein